MEAIFCCCCCWNYPGWSCLTMMFRNSRFLPIRLPAGNLHKQLLDIFFRRGSPNGGSRCHGIDYHQAKELLLKTIFDTRGNLCHGAHTHWPPRRSLFFSGGETIISQNNTRHTHSHTSWLLAAVANDDATERKLSFGRARSHTFIFCLFFCWIVAGKLEKQQSSPETTSRAIVQVAETFLKTASFSSFSQKQSKNHPPNRSGTET